MRISNEDCNKLRKIFKNFILLFNAKSIIHREIKTRRNENRRIKSLGQRLVAKFITLLIDWSLRISNENCNKENFQEFYSMQNQLHRGINTRRRNENRRIKSLGQRFVAKIYNQLYWLIDHREFRTKIVTSFVKFSRILFSYSTQNQSFIVKLKQEETRIEESRVLAKDSLQNL